MTAAIVPFRSAAHLQVDASLAELEAESRRITQRLIAEAYSAREESERLRRSYAERQARIEVLLATLTSGVKAS